jgi:hypothetical protein
MPYFNKSLFVAGLKCRLKLWNLFYRPDLASPENLSARYRMDIGIEIGQLSRALFPRGQAVEAISEDLQAVLDRTAACIADSSVPAIFEAGFLFDQIFVRVDVLERSVQGRWNLIEVKSGIEIKEHYLFDLWIQYYVLTGLGIRIEKAGILRLNKDYTYRGGRHDLVRLFDFRDLSLKVKALTPALVPKLKHLQDVIASDQPPEVEPSKLCAGCEFFDSCTRNKPLNWIYYLPRISEKKWNILTGSGIDDIAEIPENVELSPLQAIIRRCTIYNKQFIDPELEKTLETFRFPVYFLDFESFCPAVPRYSGTRPYQHIVFQWSCHIGRKDGNLQHAHFLHNEDTDPRPDFVASLLDCVRDEGTIVHYGTFERTRIRSLFEETPRFASELRKIFRRLTDLSRIIQKYYYHPGFKGSYSIKSVLPAMVPGMSYDDLEIQDGENASFQYMRMIDTSTKDREKEIIRNSLLKYCRRDTQALAEIYSGLKKAVLGLCLKEAERIDGN